MDKQPKCMLSRGGEAQLRKAFGLLRSWTPDGLAARLQLEDIGVASANASRVLISRGLSVGLLQRTDGRGGAYSLNADWRHPAGPLPPPKPARKPASARPRRLSAFELLGQMPAQRPGPLIASLGARDMEGVDADGELLPCVGARITHALHSQFQAVFGAVE